MHTLFVISVVCPQKLGGLAPLGQCRNSHFSTQKKIILFIANRGAFVYRLLLLPIHCLSSVYSNMCPAVCAELLSLHIAQRWHCISVCTNFILLSMVCIRFIIT